MKTKSNWNQHFLSIFFLSLIGFIGGSQSLVCMERKKNTNKYSEFQRKKKKKKRTSMYEKCKNADGGYVCQKCHRVFSKPTYKNPYHSLANHMLKSNKNGKCATRIRKKRKFNVPSWEKYYSNAVKKLTNEDFKQVEKLTSDNDVNNNNDLLDDFFDNI